MNILPKKRWHVRTKDNIARVRRDEAQAAEEEKERVQRAKLAEQEARTAFLRNKARSKYDGGYGETQSVQPKKAPEQKQPPESNIYTSEGNINFFKDLEDGKQIGGTNKEHEEEKKAEQEKYEKSIGYLTYLGQDSLEAKGGKAWYELDSGRITQKDEEDPVDNLQEVGLKSKSRMDPINDIIKFAGLKPAKRVIKSSLPVTDVKCSTNPLPKQENPILCEESSSKKYRYLNKRHKRKHKKEHKKIKRNKKKKSKERMKTDFYSDEEKIKKKKGKMHRDLKRSRETSSDDGTDDYNSQERKRKKTYHNPSRSIEDEQRCKNRHTRKSNSNISSGSSNMTDSSLQYSSDDEELAKEKQRKLEVLRAERLRREADERRKAERLLAGKKPDVSEGTSEIKPVFQQKYNSQFNPHIARQNQEPKPLETGVKYWLQ
ncbi:transcriptional regulator ATRX homolog [Procambarus clarkii]|uniref:transcriptional regulator ATRX homolog n=1 Tax=Procambarus clarkii TaxID=6728 RepID=UPI003742D7E1